MMQNLQFQNRKFLITHFCSISLAEENFWIHFIRFQLKLALRNYYDLLLWKSFYSNLTFLLNSTFEKYEIFF